MTRKATCHCAQLELVYEGKAVEASSICHCYSCQKRTGSIFGCQVGLLRDEVKITGNAKLYIHESDEGNPVKCYFCPTCGTTLYWELTCFPDHYVVAVGCFADKDFPAPNFSVYEERMHHWLTLPDTIEEHMA